MKNLITLTFLSLILIVSSLSANNLPRKYYVSPQGNDHWSGSLETANAQGTDGPFATVAHARDVVREQVKAGPLKQPIQVLLRSGNYYLSETLVFTQEDSGAEECPISYSAYPDEKPVISGGQLITGWQNGTVNGRTCWVANLPEVAAGKWYFKQLFVNGDRSPRARLPKDGFYRFAGIPKENDKDKKENSHRQKREGSAFYAEGEIFSNWQNLTSVEVISPNRWYESHLPIKSVDESQKLVTFSSNYIGGMEDETGKLARYYVENVNEALDEPGQWYLDRSEGKLFYLPRSGETIEALQVIAPKLQCLIRFQGTSDKKIHHLNFENLTFQHIDWSYPAGNGGSFQAAFEVPGAIVFKNTEDCTMYGCEVSKVATYAIEFGTGCSRNRVIACELHDLGAGGVTVKKGSEATTISDCAIFDGGIIYPSAIGIIVFDSGYNRLVHNHIYNFYYTGISCGWSWGYRWPQHTIDNRIEYNHIHDIGRGLLSDMGGIYTLGIQPGTVVRGNLIHDITKYGYGGWGIYLDEGSSEILVEDNITYRTNTPGFNEHYGRDNLIRNNIFAFSKSEQIGRGRQEAHRSFVYQNNIVMWNDASQKILDGYANSPFFPHLTLKQNLYWSNDEKPINFDGVTFAQWQVMGNDWGSQVANPLFVDENNGDFRLKPNSSALKMGFKPIDISNVGPRFQNNRPEKLIDWSAEAKKTAVIVRSRLELVDTIAKVAVNNPLKVRLTVQNVGEVTAKGKIAIRVTPKGAGYIIGDTLLNFSLQSAKDQSVDFLMNITATDIKDIAIETVPSGDAVIPTCLYLPNLQNRLLKISRLGTIGKSEQIRTALANEIPDLKKWMDKDVASVRMGVSGNNLALYAQVFDNEFVRKGKATDGSRFELYVSPIGSKEIKQIVFIPPTGENTSVVKCYQNMAEQPAPEFDYKINPTPDGYEILALIPLQVLGLDEKTEEFGLEMIATAFLTPETGVKPITFFNSLHPHPCMGNKDYCHVEVAK